MEEASGTEAAETALLLEREIDNRVAEALSKLLEEPAIAHCSEMHDYWGLRWHLARAVGDALMTDTAFTDKLARAIAEKLTRA